MNRESVLEGAIFCLETAGFYLARAVAELHAGAYASACVLGTVGAEHLGLFFFYYGIWRKTPTGGNITDQELTIDDHRKKIRTGLITVEAIVPCPDVARKTQPIACFGRDRFLKNACTLPAHLAPNPLQSSPLNGTLGSRPKASTTEWSGSMQRFLKRKRIRSSRSRSPAVSGMGSSTIRHSRRLGAAFSAIWNCCVVRIPGTSLISDFVALAK